MANFLDNIETQELIQKLIDKGYGDIVDMLLLNENKAYTKKGRFIELAFFFIKEPITE
jgi:hypothetical protein